MGVNSSNIAHASSAFMLCIGTGFPIAHPVRRLGETLLQDLGEHAVIKLIELSMSLARQLLAFACLEAPP